MIIDKSDFDTIYSKNENDFFFIPRTENTCYETEGSYFWSADSDGTKDCYIEINSNDNHLTNPNTSFSRYNYDEENSENLKSDEFKNSFFTIFNNQISLDEDEEEIDPYQFQFNKKHKKKIFEVIYPAKNKKIFTESEILYNPMDLFESCDFGKKQRSKVKQPRFSNKDNIRRVVKRRFDNTHLKNTFNKKLKKAGYKNFIECFPPEFAGNVTREINSSIINMTFGQILTDKSIYSGKKLYQYENNLKIVNSIKKDQNSDLNEMLNKKYSTLFEEYLNSDDFKIAEIERLRNKQKSILYIKKYEYLAKNLIKFFANTD